MGKSLNGSLIQNHLDHGASQEPMNHSGKAFILTVFLWVCEVVLILCNINSKDW